MISSNFSLMILRRFLVHDVHDDFFIFLTYASLCNKKKKKNELSFSNITKEIQVVSW